MSYDKYILYKKQVSTDGGYTWEDVYPSETDYSGTPLGSYDTLEDCENSVDYSYKVVDSSGNVYSALCGTCNAGILTNRDIPNISSSSNPIHLYIGDCIKTVDFQEDAVVPYISGITFSRRVENINAIVGYRRYAPNSITIPNTVKTIGASGAYWGDHGFQGIDNIIFETGSTLEKIGEHCFSGNTYMTSINIPDSVTSIGNMAFYQCSGLTSITIPNSVTSIGYMAFEQCSNLESVTIGSGVTRIEDDTFNLCSGLTSITIPDSVRSFGYNVFSRCSSLPYDGIWYHADNYIQRVLDNTTAATVVSYVPTIPSGTKFLGDNSLKMQNSSLDWSGFKIPSSVKFIVEYNGSSANSFRTRVSGGLEYIDTFCCGYVYDSGVTSLSVESGTRFIGGLGSYNGSGITLPNTLEVIMDGAFAARWSYSHPSLTSVTIPQDVWYLGDEAFYHQSALTSVYLNNSIIDIGEYAFAGCTSLKEINIRLGTKSIGTGAFTGCTSLSAVSISNTVETIGDSAFRDCTNLKFADARAVTSIGEKAFANCPNLIGFGTHYQKCAIPDSVTSIGQYAFSGCTSLSSVTIGSGVTSIGYGAFYNCSGLTEVTIPSSVEEIGGNAFVGTSISAFTIPEGVTSIGGGAFFTLWAKNGNITEVTINSSCPPYLIDRPFGNTDEVRIYVRPEYIDRYKLDASWSYYADVIYPIEN